MRSSTYNQNDDHNSIKVGVTAGPHAIIMEKVRELAEKKGLFIDIIEFNDFIMPNEALHHGEIDVNIYQHKPFLEQQVETRKYNIISIGDAVLMPMAIYSKKYKKINEIREGSIVAIPNDPTNGGRALLLLKEAGLINLSNAKVPTIMDITRNQKNIKFVEMDAPLLPRSLDDVDASVINTDWVIVANTDLSLAIFKESENSPYMNVIVASKEKENNPQIQKLKNIYQSGTIKEFIEKTFKGIVTLGGR